MTRFASVLLAALAVSAPVAPGQAAAVRPLDVLVLRASSHEPARTAFSTSRERWYTVTVAGLWSYNGRTGLADCGHWDPESATGWRPAPSPYLDGFPSPCTGMPFREDHTYQWVQRGTGAPLSFVIPWPTDPANDDYGGLVVVVAEGTVPAPALPASAAYDDYSANITCAG